MEPPQLGSQISLSNVLFATDFSTAAMRALPYAVGMASQYGAKLYVAHVVPIESYMLGDSKAMARLRQARQEAESNLTTVLQPVSVGGVACQSLLDNGDIWGVLSGFVGQYNVELLVLGTTGRGGLAKVLLGSVAEEAIRESPCPVLAVGPMASGQGVATLRNIVYASDFSAASLMAAPYALSFAKKFRAHLTLVHAIHDIPESPYLDAQMAKVRLNEIVASYAGLATGTDTAVEMGSAADVILKVAADTAADLIVIGARGAGAVARLSTHFGSIAHSVVSHAHCPVLTVGGSKGLSAGNVPSKTGNEG